MPLVLLVWKRETLLPQGYVNVFWQHRYTLQAKALAELTLSLANELVEEEKTHGLETAGISFQPAQAIAAKLVSCTQEIDAAFSSLMTATQEAQSGGEPEMRDLRIRGVELTNAYYRAVALVEGAETAIGAGAVDHLAPFVMITVLYTVFLLFPWVLLFLFLFRKRNYLVGEKAQLISRLGLSRQLLERSPRAAAALFGTALVDGDGCLCYSVMAHRTATATVLALSQGWRGRERPHAKRASVP